MLDVYIDRKMAEAFVNAVPKIKKEKNHSRRNRLTKAELFIRQACNLKLDEKIKKYSSHVAIFFNQGVGEHGTVLYKEFDEEEISKNNWAVALIDEENPLISKISKSNLTISKEQLWEGLISLMFNSPNQATDFGIIPKDAKKAPNLFPELIIFSGWQTFYTHPVIPLTDAVIYDSYLLQPVKFRNTYNQYTERNVRDYVEKSLVPLLKLLNSYSQDKPLTVNFFTRPPKHRDTIYIDPQLLFDCVNFYAQKFVKPINLLIVFAKELEFKDRVIYTNYFTIISHLSFHQIQDEQVLGKEEARLAIKPFAVDEIKFDHHKSMMRDLYKFYLIKSEGETQLFGDSKNLSPMIIQAHNQFNPPKP